MKVKNRRIEVRMGQTVNMGNYESMRIDVGLACDIHNDEDLDEAYDELFEQCAKQVEDYKNKE